MPSTHSEQMSGVAPWRRTASIVLMVVAVALFVLIVAGVLQTAGAIGAFAVVAASYLVGPRSPFFPTDPA
jgi:hypothetical protein